jgi:hypothetical protein
MGMTPRQQELRIIDNCLYQLVQEAVDARKMEAAQFLLEKRSELLEEFKMINTMVDELKKQ